MKKICVIGLGGYSIFQNVDAFHKDGETLHAHDMHCEAGGKGFNQAVAAGRLGAQVSFIQAAGEDVYADICEKTLADEGIECAVVRKKGLGTALATILTDRSGSNRVTVFPGAVLDEDDILSHRDMIERSDLLILQNEVPEKVNIAASRIAKEKGIKIILNPAPLRKNSKELMDMVYIITPNETEYNEAEEFKLCAVTLGAKGSLLIDNGRQTAIPPYSCRPIDTTGAGDTYTAALSVKLAEGEPLEECCIFASAASGLSTEKSYVLPSLPYRSEADEAYERLKNKGDN